MDQEQPLSASVPIARARLPVTEQQALLTWARDFWSCRYCSELVFFTPAFRAIARRFGNHGYWHPNWKANESPLLIKRGASIDHVIAVSLGGTHDMENFVTACWECNLRKSNEEGWKPGAVREQGSWDGMLALFKGLTFESPDAAERRWRRAISGLQM